MAANNLKMNTSKTEVTIIGSSRQINKSSICHLQVGSDLIELHDGIRYLGAWLDSNLSMHQHIKDKCKAAAFNIRSISAIRKYVDVETAKQLATALVLTHLDYANSILSGLPKGSISHLQKIQNWAAKV